MAAGTAQAHDALIHKAHTLLRTGSAGTSAHHGAWCCAREVQLPGMQLGVLKGRHHPAMLMRG
jgi:hypothetical protein